MPKLIAPEESVIDPSPNVRLPTVELDARVAIPEPNVPVVDKFSLLKLIAPDESVIDPAATVQVPPITDVPPVIVVVDAIAPVTSKGTVGSLSIPTLSFVASKCNKFVEPDELNFMSVVTRASSADNIPPVILPKAMFVSPFYFVDLIKGLRTFY